MRGQVADVALGHAADVRFALARQKHRAAWRCRARRSAGRRRMRSSFMNMIQACCAASAIQVASSTASSAGIP